MVRWEGYPVDESTWEPMSCLTNCTELVQEYLNQRLNDVHRRVETLLRRGEQLQAALWWATEISKN